MLKLIKKRNIPDSAVLPWNINKISSLTCFIPCLYHDWENMEITLNFVAAVLLIWFNCLKTAEPLVGNSLFFYHRRSWYSFPSGWGAGFPIQGPRVQNHGVAPRSAQPFILPRSIKWVPWISGELVVKSKLRPRSGCSLEAVEPHL